MTSLFQWSTSPSLVAISKHYQRFEFTFHNSYVILELVPSTVIIWTPEDIPCFWWGPCCSFPRLCVVLSCVFTFWVMCWEVRYDFQIKTVHLYLQLFVWGRGFMSSLHYLVLLVHSGVQHILFCVFVLFFLVLCTLCCGFLLIVHFWFPLRYSLTFI